MIETVTATIIKPTINPASWSRGEPGRQDRTNRSTMSGKPASDARILPVSDSESGDGLGEVGAAGTLAAYPERLYRAALSGAAPGCRGLADDEQIVATRLGLVPFKAVNANRAQVQSASQRAARGGIGERLAGGVRYVLLRSSRFEFLFAIAGAALLLVIAGGWWVTKRSPPGVNVASSTRLLHDDFERADAAPIEWRSGGGAWNEADGTFSSDQPAVGTSSIVLATVPGSLSQAVGIAARSDSENDGMGLIVRYLDPQNYWIFRFNKSVAAWSLDRVENGESRSRATVAPAGNAPGLTVGVESSGDRILVFADGALVADHSDPFLADRRDVGLSAQREVTSVSEAWIGEVAGV